MTDIIPRDLIRHLEWVPGQNPAKPKKQPKNKPVQNNGSAIVVPDINSREYVQVGINGIHGEPVVISCFELPDSNNMNYTNTHKKLLKSGLYVPTPAIFMTHFQNVIKAKKGDRPLLYVDGESVPDNEVKEMYKHLTTNYKDIFGKGQSGAWTWLNARFVHGDGFNNLDLETVIGLEGNKLKTKKERLLECLPQEGFARLTYNEQGLATTAGGENYSAGKNFYFYPPQKDRVARFNADSGRAGLYCNRNPSGTVASLGVFGCAEGALAKSDGGTK